MRTKWKKTDSLVRLNNIFIDEVKAHAASNILAINELSYQTDALLQTVGSRLSGKKGAISGSRVRLIPTAGCRKDQKNRSIASKKWPAIILKQPRETGAAVGTRYSFLLLGVL